MLSLSFLLFFLKCFLSVLGLFAPAQVISTLFIQFVTVRAETKSLCVSGVQLAMGRGVFFCL